MTRRKSLLGALFLSVMCFCAIGVANASAVTLHECVAEVGTGKKYSDSECKTESGSGTFQTKAIVGLQTAEPNAPSTFTLKAIVAGVNFKISCTGLTGSGKAENVEGAEMGVVGSSIVLTYTGCTVTEPAGKGCVVKTAGKASGEIGTSSLKSSTKEMTVKYVPTSGETFTTIEVSGCSVAALNGNKAVTGSASSVVGATTPTVQEFTAASGSELKFGGQAATFLGSNGLKTTNGTRLALETP